MVRVLVVDDIEVNRRIRRALLETQGYTVDVASNGTEALNLARDHRPDLVVSDVQMPGMDGFALCREWKSDRDLRDIPFVFYTATYCSDQDRRLASQLGADAYLTKATDSQDFLQAVIDIVDRSGGMARAIHGPLRNEESYYKRVNRQVRYQLEKKVEALELAHREVVEREQEMREAQARLEQRIAERTASLLAANRELESFSYSVSHDLRSPLRAIDGYAAILQQDYGTALDDRGRELLSRTRMSCQRMGVLIDKLLELSRVTRRQPKRQPVNLAEIAADIINRIVQEAPQRSVDWQIDPDLTADCDPGLIRIVLENLIDNAWKYTARQPAPVIRFYRRRFQGESMFSIADNGVGFDPTRAAQLFDAFTRAHDDPDFAGSGVGLATVQRIIEHHGGGVWAESVPGEGAVFSFTLPSQRCGPGATD